MADSQTNHLRSISERDNSFDLEILRSQESARNKAMTHMLQPEPPSLMEMLDVGALSAAPIPIVGDIAGLGADAYRYATKPESRNWTNYGLSALGALPFVPPLGGMVKRVYHGGPTKWAAEHGFPKGRPRLDKLGTGEGAQAYGHGFYAAESPGVAETYRLTGRINKGSAEEAASAALYDTHGKADKAIEFLERSRTDIYGGPEIRQEAIKLLRAGERPKAGSLYDLGLPDEDAAKMLDWDAPLSEQPHILEKFNLDERGRVILPNGERTLPSKLRGEQLYRAMGEGTLQGPVGASDALRKAGIPGLKYYDQMSRGQKYWVARHPKGGTWELPTKAEALEHIKRNPEKVLEPPKQTRNYVIWDQDVLNRTTVTE